MYKNLDPLLHAPLRLAIVSHLMAHPQVSFTALKKYTEASSGNLSVQLKKTGRSVVSSHTKKLFGQLSTYPSFAYKSWDKGV